MQYPTKGDWKLAGEGCAGCSLDWWRAAWKLVLRLEEEVAEEVAHDE